MFCTETSHFICVEPFVFKFLIDFKVFKLSFVTDDPILLAALVIVFRNQNTESRALEVGV